MPEIERVTANGQEYIGIPVDFETLRNDWSEYRLPGGGGFRVQTEVTKCLWLTDESGNKQYHVDGRPSLFIWSIRHFNSHR